MEVGGLVIAIRFALFFALGGLFGLTAFGLWLRPERNGGGVLLSDRWLAGGAIASLLISAVGLVLVAAQMAGTSPLAMDRETLSTIFWDTPMGAAWFVRTAALVIAILALWAPVKARRTIALVAFGLAVASFSWAGHGSMDEGFSGWVHLLADILHLIAAGAWLGALLALLLLVARPAARIDAAHLNLTHRALSGFSAVGSVIVGTIVASGLVNSWMMIGPENVLGLGASLYGQLLIAKLGLFAAMLALASLNRFKLTPALERSIAADDHPAALLALRSSIAVETGCALVIIALVAWLGTLEPPISASM